MSQSFFDISLPTTWSKWWATFPKSLAPQIHNKTEVEVLDLKSEAKKHLEAETAAYQLRRSKTGDSEYGWLKVATVRGTLKDRVAALIVLIQEDPKYNLARITSLVALVKGLFKVIKQGDQETSKKHVLVNDVKDLFLQDLLHPRFKLMKFEEQDLNVIPTATEADIQKNGKIMSRKRLLAHWYFEDQLKDNYEKFLTALSSVAAENTDANREKAIGIMADLIINNSEQEQKILDFLVNKVGDPKEKVAAKAVYCLNKLLLEHPNMKMVVLKEMEKFLFRANVAQRAQYYAICLLTQYVLNRNDAEVATTLIDVYFAFFKACLKKGEPSSRMMAGILAGVNRAYKFANLNNVKINEHIDTVYKVVHVGSFNVSLNALGLLYQITGTDPTQEDRFHTAFYKKLLDPEIGSATKRTVFLNLLYRVMKNDKNVSRVYAFMKRTIQVAAFFPPCWSCAVLYAISQLYKFRKDLQQMIVRPPVVVKIEKKEEQDSENTENKEEDEQLEENSNTDESKASKKSKKMRNKNKNKSYEQESKNQEEIIQDDDDNEVQYVENTLVLSNVIVKSINTNAPADEDKKNIAVIQEDSIPFYNPFAINPLGSGAVKSPLTDLLPLYRHYHPSVVLFARKVIEGNVIDYTGDPLVDLSLIRFLDRYVFRNPKKLQEKKVSKGNDPLAMRTQYIPRGLKSLPVDSEAYLNENEERIPADELFLYKYLKHKNKTGMKRDDEDNESVNSEEFNELLDELGGDKDFEELDIAGELQSHMKKGKLKDIHADDSDKEAEECPSDDDETEDECLDKDDEESMDEDDGSSLDLSELDDDASDMEFNDSEEEIDPKSSKKWKNNSMQKAMKKKGIDSNAFISAETFAEILEEQGRSKHKPGGSNALSDADGANLKQLDWEANRHQKIAGNFGRNKRKFNKAGLQDGKNKKFKNKN